MSVMKRAGRNYLALITAEVISRAIAYLIIVYIARSFGTVSFGNVTFAQVFAGYAALLSDFGLTTHAITVVARNKQLTHTYVMSILKIRLVVGILLFVGFSLYAWLWLPGEEGLLLIAYAFGLVIMALDIGWVFQAHEKLSFNSLLKILNQGVYAGSFFTFIYFQKALIMVPIASLLGMLFSAITGWGLYVSRIRLNSEPQRLGLRQVFRSAYPVGLSAFMYSIYLSFDTIMLKYMKGAYDTGLYSAAYKLILILLTLTTFYNIVMLPVLSSRFVRDLESVKKIVNYSIKLMAIVAVPICLGGIIIAEEIINFVYGQAFSPAVLSLRILLGALMVIFISAPLNLSLLACDRQSELTKIVSFGALLNIGLNLVLIPSFSLNGAAAATALTELLVLLLSLWRVKEVFDITVFNQLVRPLAAAFIMTLVIYSVSAGLWVSIFLGSFVYLLAMLIIKGISKDEWRFIGEIFSLADKRSTSNES